LCISSWFSAKSKTNEYSFQYPKAIHNKKMKNIQK